MATTVRSETWTAKCGTEFESDAISDVTLNMEMNEGWSQSLDKLSNS